jgi:hypothetical protein
VDFDAHRVKPVNLGDLGDLLLSAGCGAAESSA